MLPMDKPEQPFMAEASTFEAQLPALLSQHAGKYALVHGTELVGVFDTEANALAAGYQKFGPVPLYIRQVLPEEQKASAPALVLGILTAA
jgi:hypothetical protein